MRNKNKNILKLIPLILISCGIIPVKESMKSNTASVIELGAIGKYDSNLIDKQFHVQAIPKITEKIRVASFLKKFNSSSSKNFNKIYESNQLIDLNDTLNTKPSYFLFTIMDKVTMQKELNSVKNADVFNFLKTSNESLIITTIAIKFPIKIQNKIRNADELFITSNGLKLVLQLFVKGELNDLVDFSKGAVFDYSSSNFCWSENSQHRIDISGISENKCDKKTYKSYAKALKKKKEFKY